MEIFAQQCKKCNEFITAELDNERPKHLVKWLHRWIANMFYGFHFRSSGYRGRQTLLHHETELCEACSLGLCAYPRRYQPTDS